MHSAGGLGQPVRGLHGMQMINEYEAGGSLSGAAGDPLPPGQTQTARRAGNDAGMGMGAGFVAPPGVDMAAHNAAVAQLPPFPRPNFRPPGARPPRGPGSAASSSSVTGLGANVNAMAGGGGGSLQDGEDALFEQEQEQERRPPWPPTGFVSNWASGDDLLDAPVQATHIDAAGCKRVC